MICRLLNRPEIKLVSRSLLRFLDRSVLRAMGCFFDCFRIRDDDHRQTNRQAVASKNTLSSLFLCPEKGESSCSGSENDRHTIIQISDGLRQEAMFLKACGTIPETPIEIRKALQKFKSSPPCDKHSDPSKFHSWLSSSSIKKLPLDEQSEQPDQSPTNAKLPVEGRWAGSLEQSPISNISSAHNPARVSISFTEGSEQRRGITLAKDPAEGNITALSPFDISSAQCRNKSVRFECDLEGSSKSSSGSSSQICNKYESPGIRSVSKPSPNPTPLRLSDEMQTPGTDFPSALGTLADGKTRIRSQYVYSVSNPIENMSHWNVIKEESSISYPMSDDQSEHTAPMWEATSVAKDSKLEASLSSWLKKPSSTHENNQDLEEAYRKNPVTPGDRPIIGMVAAHWNADESSNISPKWWDGNGIPNSTNKYKEDQKVCWHATPFEERLEKALSEESLVSQRKQVNGSPIIFEESEESDTALSQLPLQCIQSLLCRVE